jgi:CelD/BcsL family acetyltransferase involved in cellulose biosynthesis
MKSVESVESFGPFDTFERSIRSSERSERIERSERLTVKCIRDQWGFTLLRPYWNDLLQASAADNPFLTWEWQRTWWTHLGEPEALRLLVVYDGDVPVAIAPLRVVNESLGLFRRLELLGTGHAGSDYLDIIIRRDYESAACASIAEYLRSAGSALYLAHVRADSSAALVARQLVANGWSMNAAPDGTCPVIPLEGHTWDSVLATMGSSHRANVRRRMRALEQAFDVRVERVTNDVERRTALRSLTEFSGCRWKDHGGSTAFASAAMSAFQDEVTRRFLGRGWLRMYVLHLNRAPAAVMYGFYYRRRFYFYQHGFDERLRTHSVGLVLMAETIRAALEEGAREFDMLWGVEPYKFLWARDSRALSRLELFPVDVGGVIHRGALTAKRSARTLARRVRSWGAHLWS